MHQTSVADSDGSFPADARSRVARFRAYQVTAAGLFPGLPVDLIELWSLTADDAMSLACFFDCWHRETAVIEVGAFIGASAFFFGQQPGVQRVFSIDPNPLVADEINDKQDSIGSTVSAEALEGVHVFDIASRVAATFPDANTAAVEFIQGVAAAPEGATLSSGDFHTVTIPTPEALNVDETVGFVDGLHTPVAVEADLTALAATNPLGLIFLDDCRNYWGPFVQSGVARFLEKSPHQFRLLCDVHPSLATCTLGLVYPSARANEIEALLNRIGAHAYARYLSVAPVGHVADARTLISSLQEKVAAAERDAQALTAEVTELRTLRERAEVSLKQAQDALLATQSTRTWRLVSTLHRIAVALHLRSGHT